MITKTLIGLILLLMVMSVGQPHSISAATEITQLSKHGSVRGTDLDRFLEAKEHVLQMEWEMAREELESYLKDFPVGDHRDEVLYWLAKSLNRLSRTQTDIERVIDLKSRAANHLDELLETRPESVWRDDAEALRMEISGELALMGVEEHKKYIEDLALRYDPHLGQAEKGSESEEEEYHTILTLHTLTVLEPAVAVPILKRTLKVHPRIEIRKEAMSLMAENYPEDALPVLRGIEQLDPDDDLRNTATRLIYGIKQTQIPAYLNYYGFSFRLKDERQRSRIPEGELVSFDLPCYETGSVKKVQKSLKDFFDGKASGVSVVTFSFKVARTATMLAISGVPELMTYREVGRFRVELPCHGEEFVKRYNRITGRIRFVDLEKHQSYERSYTVDDSGDRLFAMRVGDEVAAFVLQFESPGEDIEMPKEPKYNMYFEDVLGAELRSTRHTVSIEELAHQTALVDYGESRAEVPGDDGKWVLVGHILVDTRERLFIGRKAILMSPEGKPIVQAAEVVVPAENPEEFYVTRSE